MIQAVGLTKQYGAKTAVYNLSFQVRPGAVTGFLGPNGSGKSTTMRMILGLDAPTAGQVTIGGLPYRRLPNAPRRVGALLDAKAVHGGRSARQHLLCLAQLSGIPARRVDEVLGVVGLQDVAGRRSKGFSLGMGQRLGIAGALLGDPEVLLFDEPVNGLDPEGIHWVRNLMRKLASEGRTVFVSSHLMSEMALTADHLVVIGRGQLLADMSVKDFIARNSTGYALLRTPADTGQREKLTAALAEAGGSVQPEQDGALRVTGLELPRISDIAHDADVRLWELSPHQASLEEAYMRLTNGAVDYRSAQDPRQGLQQHRRTRCRGRRSRAGASRRSPGGAANRPRRSRSSLPRRAYGAAPVPAQPAAPPPHRRTRGPARGSRRPRPDQARQRGRPMTAPAPAPAPYGYQQPQFSSQIPVEKTRLSQALASEWTKIRTVRSTVWTLGVMLLLVVGINLLVLIPLHSSDDTSVPVLAPGLFGLMLGQMAILTLGVLVITSEYGTGMIRTTFTACPQRSRVLAAKAIVFFAVSFVTTTVACAMTAVVSNAVIGGRRITSDAVRARRRDQERPDRRQRLRVAGRDRRRRPVRGAARPARAVRGHPAAALRGRDHRHDRGGAAAADRGALPARQPPVHPRPPDQVLGAQRPGLALPHPDDRQRRPERGAATGHPRRRHGRRPRGRVRGAHLDATS